MWIKNKIVGWFHKFFKKEIITDEAKLFKDINKFIKNCPEIDFKEFKKHFREENICKKCGQYMYIYERKNDGWNKYCDECGRSILR